MNKTAKENNVNKTNVSLYVGDKEFGHTTFDFKATHRSVLKRILAYAVSVFKQVYLQPTLLSYNIHVTDDLNPSRVVAYFSVMPLPGIEEYALNQLRNDGEKEPKKKSERLAHEAAIPSCRKYAKRVKQLHSSVTQDHVVKADISKSTLDDMLDSTSRESSGRKSVTRNPHKEKSARFTIHDRVMWMNMLQAGASPGSVAAYFDISPGSVISSLRGYRWPKADEMHEELRAEALRTQLNLKDIRDYTQQQLDNIRLHIPKATFLKSRWNSAFLSRLTINQANQLIYARHMRRNTNKSKELI